MNWWDTSNLTNLASQAIKTATKKIDKVLDIKDEEEKESSTGASLSAATLPASVPTGGAAKDSFFSNWLGGNSVEDASSGNLSLPQSISNFSETTKSSPGPSSTLDKIRKSRQATATSSSTSINLNPTVPTTAPRASSYDSAGTLQPQNSSITDGMDDFFQRVLESSVGTGPVVSSKSPTAGIKEKRGSGKDSVNTGDTLHSDGSRAVVVNKEHAERSQNDKQMKQSLASASGAEDPKTSFHETVSSSLTKTDTGRSSAFKSVEQKDNVRLLSNDDLMTVDLDSQMQGKDIHMLTVKTADRQNHYHSSAASSNDGTSSSVSIMSGVNLDNDGWGDVSLNVLTSSQMGESLTVEKMSMSAMVSTDKPITDTVEQSLSQKTNATISPIHVDAFTLPQTSRTSIINDTDIKMSTSITADAVATTKLKSSSSASSLFVQSQEQMNVGRNIDCDTSKCNHNEKLSNVYSQSGNLASGMCSSFDNAAAFTNDDCLPVSAEISCMVERRISKHEDVGVVSSTRDCDHIALSSSDVLRSSSSSNNSVISLESSIELSETSDSLSESNRTLCLDDSDTSRDIETPRCLTDAVTCENEGTLPLDGHLVAHHTADSLQANCYEDMVIRNSVEGKMPKPGMQLPVKKSDGVNDGNVSEVVAADYKSIEQLVDQGDKIMQEFGVHEPEQIRRDFVKSFVESNALSIDVVCGEAESDGCVDGSGGVGIRRRGSNAREDGINIERGDRTVGNDGEAKSDSPHSNASSSSYIKNLLEDAMAESAKDSTTDSHCSEAGGVYSEGGGVCRGSGHSSGHTSADEVDTTTSSDIEIISHMSTSSCGTNRLYQDAATSVTPHSGSHHGFNDVSPRRLGGALTVAAGGSGGGRMRGNGATSPPGHRRSDSGSSAQSLQEETVQRQRLYYKKGGNLTHDSEYQHHDRARGSLEGGALPFEHGGIDFEQFKQNNPYDTDKLLKKLAEMAEILDARERRQVELSAENVDLVEANNVLRTQLQQLEQSCEAEMEDLKAVTDEFTRRLGEEEKRLQAVCRERDMLKKLVQESEESSKKADYVLTEKLLKEKEQVIAELLEEGEKLSKQQLNSNNIIKKLRAKEKEAEGTNKSLKQRVDEQKAEMERLEEILEGKIEVEKKNADAINQLNAVMKTQEDEINRLKNELEDSTEKCRSMKVALDNSYKEISELHKARVTHVSEIQASVISAELQAKEQLKQSLDERQQQARREQESLITQIEDLQLSLSRLEKEHGRREDLLRQEISDLQQRLQEAEERNQDLTQSMSAATRPLLRQIENIQSTYAVQLTTYERVEKSLTDRLTEAQTQLLEAMEKERNATERLLDSTTRIASLESHVSSLRQDKSRLQAQLEVERTKLEVLEESKHNESAQRDTMRQKVEQEISELKKEKLLLENQLEMERMRSEAEVKKVALVHEQLREKEMLLSLRRSPSFSREDSIVSADTPTPSTPMSSSLIQEDKSYMLTSAHGGRVSLYESVRQSNASLLLESLQSQLKQREGEIAQLQSDIGELERTREAMAREMVNLSIQKEKQDELIQELTAFQQKHIEVEGRYQALLQMYGEKVEETQELKLDLQEVKDMYKMQIDELLMSKTKTKREF